MPAYFEYALKVSISLAVVFLFYALLLKRITYYRWNRYFLLTFSMLCFIVPFLNINAVVEPREKNVISFVNEIPSVHSFEIAGNSSNPAMMIYWKILSGVFLIVSFALVLRLLIQLLSIRKIKSRSTLLVTAEEKIYDFNQKILPFSFFESIFINLNNYSEKELKDILEHERVHIREKHSIDMLVAEIVCTLNWYNPFAWMIKNAIRENLEFIADDVVMKKGVDKKHYQYLLLKVTGSLPSSVASGFKFSSLKSRIIMMNKDRTSGVHLLKFVLLVPVIALVLLAFRNRKEAASAASSSVKTATAETYTLSTLTYSIADEKVKSIVIKEKDKSLLKTGDVLSLALLHDEKDRLKSLLEKSGYTNLKSNAIRFIIDTASANNIFSVEIKINLEPSSVSIDKKEITLLNDAMIESKLTRSFHAGEKAKENSRDVFALSKAS